MVLMGERQLGLHMEGMPGGHLLNTDQKGSGTKEGMPTAPVQHEPAWHRHTGHSLQVRAHRAHLKPSSSCLGAAGEKQRRLWPKLVGPQRKEGIMPNAEAPEMHKGDAF